MLVLARCVVVMVKLDQVRDFLQFNRLVRNVQGQVKRSLIHVLVVEVKARNNPLKRLSVTIPKGVDDGTRIRLSGKGEAGTRGGSNGDLYLFVNVYSHDLFKRSDENLFFECPISIADAALGTSIEIPTIDGGKAKIKIPPGTQSGKQFRLRGKACLILRGNGMGDLYIQVNTEVPISLNKEQKELLEKFREIENEKSNPSIKKFFQKLKVFWKN